MKIITGTVVQGKKKGRTLGFPTANIEIDSSLDFEPGIYAGYVFIGDKKYESAVYFSGEKIIEAFIFNFDEDLYGKELSIELVKKIRDKKNFQNDEEAIEQIKKDILEIKKCLQE